MFLKGIIVMVIFSINAVKSYNPPWMPYIRSPSGKRWYTDYLCKDNNNIVSIFEPLSGLKQDYYLWINEMLKNGTEILVKFDLETTVYPTSKYNNISNIIFKTEPDTVNNIYHLEFYNVSQLSQYLFRVEGQDAPHHPSYILSLKINGVEKCREPNLGLFGKYYPISKYLPDAPDEFCGRRKLNTQRSQNPLIVSGSATLEGWWPWHAALYRIKQSTLTYICGGTLISRHLVLTAAHCVTTKGIPVNPDVLGVVLGKFSLFGSDTASQSVEVKEVIVHEEFSYKKLKNDIALIKLLAAAVYTNYVQPACLWFDGIYDQLGSYEVTGTVVGWGFDRTNNLTKTLHTATMPQVTDVTCILFEPTFYYNILDGKKFCAGHKNGTTPCNGDSGGGYMVFVEDPPKRSNVVIIGKYKYILNHNFCTPPCYMGSGGRCILLSDQQTPCVTTVEDTPEGGYVATKKADFPGAWYVKGIVSSTLARADAPVCDPNGYTVFTDVAKYRDWILGYMNRDS